MIARQLTLIATDRGGGTLNLGDDPELEQLLVQLLHPPRG